MTCPECRSPNDDAAEVCFTCGKSLVVAPAAITRGSVIAERYEVLSPLGRGGMGMVYKAHDRILDETVAVKTLRADVAREAEGARRFRSEIKLARTIRHRNVCAIHEYGESGGLRYIAMELVDGVDLRRQIQERGALPEREAFEVAVQAASGLQAIHKAGIIHRDLKTSNIMRDAAGRVLVMDFGIAKRFGTESTLAGRVMGTPEYMSPEQARGHKLDFRCDIYALGVVIYEVFTGRVPFQGETPIATILMHLNEPPPLEGPGAQRIPTPLVRVLRQALAKSPDDRFSTARELAEALEAARTASGDAEGPSARERASAGRPARGGPGERDEARRGTPRPSTPAGAVAWSSAWNRRFHANRWVVVAAGVALAVALALLTSNRDKPVPPPRSEPTATPPASLASPPASSGSVPTPALSIHLPEPSPKPSPTPVAAPSAGWVSSPPARPKPSTAPVAENARPTIGPTAVSTSAAPGPLPTTIMVATAPPTLPPTTPSATTMARPGTPRPTRRGEVAEAGPGVTPPQPVNLAEPAYPTLAKRLKRRARVLIRALVDENGKVVEAKVAEGDSSKLGFDEAALEAAYKMLYKPALKDGVPVKMWIELPFTFRP